MRQLNDEIIKNWYSLNDDETLIFSTLWWVRTQADQCVFLTACTDGFELLHLYKPCTYKYVYGSINCTDILHTIIQ